MKKSKTITIAMLMTVMSTSASAAETAMKVSMANGSSATYLLSERPVVTFTGEKMLITAPDASTEYPRSEVINITFSSRESTSISITGNESTLAYIDGRISAPGKFITIYDLSGRIVLTANEEACVEPLSSGIYIVKADNQTLKIKK